MISLSGISLKLFRDANNALETEVFSAKLFLLTKLRDNLKSSNVGTIVWIKLWHLYEVTYTYYVTKISIVFEQFVIG